MMRNKVRHSATTVPNDDSYGPHIALVTLFGILISRIARSTLAPYSRTISQSLPAVINLLEVFRGLDDPRLMEHSGGF